MRRGLKLLEALYAPKQVNVLCANARPDEKGIETIQAPF
jgi:hypothetical protein